jgi:FkbM family methyltransferase
MNGQEILLSLYRGLRPLVDRCHLNAVARPVWAALWKPRAHQLIRAEQNGRTWRLDPEVALRGAELEMDTIRWLRSVVRPGMTVVDVGANVGQMTLEMAQLVGPAGRVVAIEPGPGNLEVLRRHVDGNGFGGRVTVIAAACCAHHRGKMELEMPAANPDEIGSGFQLRGIGIAANPLNLGRPHTRLEVDTVSLDGLAAEMGLRPGVLKIDVEGAELEVVKGGRTILREARPEVSIGFHPFAFTQPGEAQAEIIAAFEAARLSFGRAGEVSWMLGEYIATAARARGDIA